MVQGASLTVSGWTRHSSAICDDRPGAFQRSGSLSPGVTRHLNKPSPPLPSPPPLLPLTPQLTLDQPDLEGLGLRMELPGNVPLMITHLCHLKPEGV